MKQEIKKIVDRADNLIKDNSLVIKKTFIFINKKCVKCDVKLAQDNIYFKNTRAIKKSPIYCKKCEKCETQTIIQGKTIETAKNRFCGIDGNYVYNKKEKKINCISCYNQIKETYELIEERKNG